MTTMDRDLRQFPTLAQLSGVRVRYGEVEALRGVHLELDRGSTTLLIGPNGSGKTTLLKVLMGFLRASEGKSRVAGMDSWGRRAAIAEIATLFDDQAALPRRVPLERLALGLRQLQPRFRPEVFERALAEADIPPSRLPTQLSKGQAVNAYLALCVAIDADLLMLDEPTLGMDIVARARFRDLLQREYLDGERTALISTHYPEEVTELATHLCFLEKGEVILHAPVQEALQRYRVVPAAQTPDGGGGGGWQPRVLRGADGSPCELVDLAAEPKRAAEGEAPTVAQLYIGLVAGAVSGFAAEAAPAAA